MYFIFYKNCFILCVYPINEKAKDCGFEVVLEITECDICSTRVSKVDVDRILCFGEAIFKLNGCTNCHNCVYWATENPKVIIDTHVNLTDVCVWCAISSQGILVPFFFDETVTAQSYLVMLQHQLLPLLLQQDEAMGSVLSEGWDTGPFCYAWARLAGCQPAW